MGEVVRGNFNRKSVNTSKNITSKPKAGGGNGSGTTVTPETQRYVDLKTDATRAQNDARFAEILVKLDNLPRPMTWQQCAAVVATALGIMLAILAFSADRFDGGTLYADRKAAFEAGWNANRGMKHVPQLEIEHWSDKNIDSITFIV